MILQPSKQHLMFLKNLYFYNDVKKDISQSETKNNIGYLWYHSEETISLGLLALKLVLNKKLRWPMYSKEH